MNSLARLSSPSFHLAPPPGPALLPPGPPQCFLHSATKETVYVRSSHPCSAQSLSLALASCIVKTKVLIVAHKALHNCPHLLFQGYHLRPLSLAHSSHLPPLCSSNTPGLLLPQTFSQAVLAAQPNALFQTSPWLSPPRLQVFVPISPSQ